MSVRGLAVVVGGVLALAACTPPLPPDVLAAKAEDQITCQQGSVTAGVPEAFTGALDAVNATLSGVCPEQAVVEAVDQADAPLQVVDHAPTPEETAAFAADACPTGTPITVPAFGYAVALAYNVIGLEGLVMTPQAIAGILNGTVTSWEDPLITDANADYDLTGLPPITVLGVDQPQGAVEAMTSWLAADPQSGWTDGVMSTLPNATTFPTQMDLLNELLAIEGNVAVLPVAAAVANTIPVAAVPVGDLIVSPDDTQLVKVGLGATTLTVDEAGNIAASPAIGGVPVEGNFDLAASKIVLAEGQPLVGWPINGVAHMMICDAPTDPLPLSTAQYVVRLAGQGSLESFGVTPLPEPIRVKTFTPLKVTVNLDASASPSGGAQPSGEAQPSASS